MTEQELARVKGYINQCTWVYAKTYSTVPHQYIVREKCGLTYAQFNDFVVLQRTHGRRERWRSFNNTYLYIDGYKYWTMTGTVDEQGVINRQKVFNEFDLIADDYAFVRSMEDLPNEHPEIVNILRGISGSVYEIGCGNGKFIDFFPEIKPKNYLGVDASSKMIASFYEHHEDHRAVTKAYEEDGERYLEFDNVVALFGSGSYIMPEYMAKLGRYNNGGLFLMFYAPGYLPNHYDDLESKMHMFPYTENDLRRSFPDCRVYRYKGYIIVSKFPQPSLF